MYVKMTASGHLTERLAAEGHRSEKWGDFGASIRETQTVSNQPKAQRKPPRMAV